MKFQNEGDTRRTRAAATQGDVVIMMVEKGAFLRILRLLSFVYIILYGQQFSDERGNSYSAFSLSYAVPSCCVCKFVSSKRIAMPLP